MLVPELVAHPNANIPSDFYESLPQFCSEEKCGFPMEISETLTHLNCSNPRCPHKLTQRLVSMLNVMGIKDMGEAKAKMLIDGFIEKGIHNHLYVFAYDPETEGSVHEKLSVDYLTKICNQVQEKNSFTLAEFVRAANLPYLQTSTTQLLGDYDDLSEFYNDLESDGVDLIINKLSLKKSEESEDISVRALNIYNTLAVFRTDLEAYINDINIIQANSGEIKKLTAVCSDEVGEPFKTKADFYAQVNAKYNDIHVEFLGSVNKSIDYLVWAGADGSPARLTSKVKKIQGYNEKFEKNKAEGKVKEGEHYIPIVTAKQFMDILDKM